jgi:hypothetical protein
MAVGVRFEIKQRFKAVSSDSKNSKNEKHRWM